MIVVSIGVGVVCLLVGFVLGRRRAIEAAINDDLRLAEFAWTAAAVEAKRDGFAEFPAKPWGSLTSAQRDAVHRLSAATVSIIKREAGHRSRLSGTT